jgi:hypothetical protein
MSAAQVPTCVQPCAPSHASVVHGSPSSQSPQSVHTVAPPSEKVPGVQVAQLPDPSWSAAVPAGQGVHDVMPAPAAIDPAGQLLQLAAPGALEN